MYEYIVSVYNIFRMINKKSDEKRDQRLKAISIIMYNYLQKISKENNISLENIPTNILDINLVPIFDFISNKQIQLYDFTNIDVDDVDINKDDDMERFVLSHIYYITQPK